MKYSMLAPLALFLWPTEATAPAPSRPAAVTTRDEEHEVDPRDLVGLAKISLGDAITRALAARPGRAVEAELEGERDDDAVDVFFEVLVLAADGELYELRLDPANGNVRSNEEAEEDEDEIPGFVAAIRHSELTLGALVDKATSYVKGTPVKAALEYEDGGPHCDVVFANTRHLIEVEVEGRAGHLTEIELRPEDLGWGHDDGDDDEHTSRGDDDEDEEMEEIEDVHEEHAEHEATEEHEEHAEHEEHSEGGRRRGGKVGP